MLFFRNRQAPHSKGKSEHVGFLFLVGCVCVGDKPKWPQSSQHPHRLHLVLGLAKGRRLEFLGPINAEKTACLVCSCTLKLKQDG